METQAKGSGFLKVTGILMIIGASVSIIMSIIVAIGVAALAVIGSARGMLYASTALMIVSAAAEMVTGILGVVNCKKPEKAKTCIAWGIIVAVLCVAGTVLSVAGDGDFNIVSLLIGLVLPVLYIIGASLNAKA